MHPPQRARPPGFAHRGGVERPDPQARFRRLRQTSFAKQRHAQPVQPARRLPKPLQQRHIGQLRQTRLARTHDRLAQRVSAAQMQQKNPKHRLRRLVLTQPLQRTAGTP